MPVAATLYDWLKFLHVLAAMIWLGGVVAVTVLAGNVLRSGTHDAVDRFVVSLRVLGPLTLGPASLAVLGFGIWLVLDSEAWNLGQAWIILALTIVAAAFVVGGVIVGRAARDAQRAASAGDRNEATRQLRRWSWGMRLILLLLVVATWEMVFKPGL
jgi:uncharacterized membrane protein